MKWILPLLLLSTLAFAECVEPVDGMTITESTEFCSSTYDLLSGITITGDNLVVDCHSAILRGIVGQSEIGLKVVNSNNLTLRNCNIVTFTQGLYLKNVTNSLIEDNSLLKNRIGIRLLDAFENSIKNNNDKSFQVAVSAINSKYNYIIHNNKDIKRAFCAVNACNQYKDMNVCEAGDFYCSKKCTPATDPDCGKVVVPEVENEPVKTVDELIEEVMQEVESKQTPKNFTLTRETFPVPFNTKILVYILFYFLTFAILKYTKKR